MATLAEMGEVDEIHTTEDGLVNGDVSDSEMEVQDCDISPKTITKDKVEDQMDTDEVTESQEEEENDKDNEEEEDSSSSHSEDGDNEEPVELDENEESVELDENEESVEPEETEEPVEIDENELDESKSEASVENIDSSKESNAEETESNKNEENEELDKESESEHKEDSNSKTIDETSKEEEIQEIEDDDDVIHVETKQNGEETIELNDSGPEDGDVMFVDQSSPKQNGTAAEKDNSTTPNEVIELDVTPVKNSKKSTEKAASITPRRSSRNLNKKKSYAELEREEEEETIRRAPVKSNVSDESDIEEILPEDPLANIGDSIQIEKIMPIGKRKIRSGQNSGTIVVKDTKRLVEIASKSNTPQPAGKKEPTLVIIDTNSILSGKGPIPVSRSLSITSSTSTTLTPSQAYSTVLPMALPAQGIYPPNMRATITPIPVSSTPNRTSSSQTNSTPVLPTLTDDMFVVEAPSFIVPYVYEKPPVNDFKRFVEDYKKEVDKLKKEIEDLKKEEDKSKGGEAKETENKEPAKETENKETGNKESAKDVPPKEAEKAKSTQEASKAAADDGKTSGYFTSPLGKFFTDIGMNLVQEFVQTDLLKQQKRKRDRERSRNPETLKTIHSLIKNLEFTKENNEAYRLEMKKCEFCSYKTESALSLAYHLETPHMKNYLYKCNFCPYEIRSPHDILFHMEAEHMVQGRLERAPSFHQCPSCPFEDNQKSKLSRHLIACTRKFKAEKNLEPPIDWEPPAKIPRVSKMRQGLNATAYQALSKQSQFQFLSKMQLQSNSMVNRGRGRPSLSPAMKPGMISRPTGMVYKQNMSGGSVLVPANYALSGNQMFQQAQQKAKPLNTPSISITPLPRGAPTGSASMPAGAKPGDTNSKNSFVICEICDGYIKDLEQLRNHMQWIHKVKIHPKMIYNRPPLNCQKCQFRFFTDQGLERHLLGSHGLVTSSMQDAANRSKDAGRCPVCGRVYQWKLLNHVARDHNMTLKPAHLSYKCTVCTATFGMYKQFENHVYSAHSVVAKRVMDKKGSNAQTSTNKASAADQSLKPLKINDEITIIPQPAKATNGPPPAAGKESSPAPSAAAATKNTPGTSKNEESTPSTSSTRAERLARRNAAGGSTDN